MALTLGSLFLYTPESNLAVDMGLVVGVMLTFAAALIFVVVLLVRDRRKPAVTGVEGLVGEIGVTTEDLRGRGTVRVHGELWRASCPDVLNEGTRVKVVSVEGLELKVQAEETEAKE